LRAAVTLFVLAMVLALSTLLPVSLALRAGAVGMVIAGVLNMDEAYASINWKTVFLVACLIPLGYAMDRTGAANWVAQRALEWTGDNTPTWILQAALAFLTVCFSLVIGNVGATVIMVSMSINIALAHGYSPPQFALLAALSASNKFLSHSNPVV